MFAEALAFAIRTGGSRQETYRFALDIANRAESPQSVVEAITKAASQPPHDYSTQMGWVLIALQNAFWQLLHAESLEEGIVSTVMAGGDTDTNAAIAGALLGAVWARRGSHAMAGPHLVLQADLGNCRHHATQTRAFWPVDALWLAERLVWLGGTERTTK